MIKNFDLEEYLFAKSKRRGQPVRAVLELTPACNFNCKICYVRHSKKEACEAGGIKDVIFWKNLIPQMKKMGVLIVTLIGGEPLLYDGFQEIYSELIDNGFLVNITTNGSMLTDEIIELFRAKPPRYVTVSLYGASDETYKRMTGNAQGFSMMISGIEKMLDAGIGVKLTYIPAPENCKDFEAIYEIKKKYDLPILTDPYCFPATRKVFTVNQERLSSKMCADFFMEAKKRDPKVNYKELCKRVAAHEVSRLEAMHTSGFSCYAGSALFWINWKGQMMPCGFLENLSVSFSSNDLALAWEKLKRMVSAIHTAEKCSACENRELCQVCPAAMYCETGSFEEAPEYLCEMTEEIIRIAHREQ